MRKLLPLIALGLILMSVGLVSATTIPPPPASGWIITYGADLVPSTTFVVGQPITIEYGTSNYPLPGKITLYKWDGTDFVKFTDWTITTASGKIPYTWAEAGYYELDIEGAKRPIAVSTATVVPELPYGTVLGVATMIGSVLLVSNKKAIFARF
jgi:hypothetical protein